MATIVASLMATIGGDASGLNKALTGAKGSLQKTAKEMGTFGGSVKDTITKLGGLALAGGVAYKAVGGVVDFFKNSVNNTMDYAKAVRDVARYTGTSAEESSKFLQIADDLQIETSALKMGFRNLTNEGIQPNIENIKDLATQYQELKNPVDKAQFAMKMFGARSGMEMAKMLEMTSEQIDNIAQSAEDLGLVLDESAIKATEDYRLSVDTLNDSWKGLQTTIAMGVIPQISELTTGAGDLVTAYSLAQKGIEQGRYSVLDFFTSWMSMSSQAEIDQYINDMRDAFVGAAVSTDDFAGRAAANMNEAGEAVGGFTTKILGLTGLFGNLALEFDPLTAAQKLFNEGLSTGVQDLVDMQQAQLNALAASGKLTQAQLDAGLAQQENLRNIRDLNTAYQDGTITQGDYFKAISDGMVTNEELNDELGYIPGNLTAIQEATGITAEKWAEYTSKVTGSVGEVEGAIGGITGAIGGITSAAGIAASAIDSVGASINALPTYTKLTIDVIYNVKGQPVGVGGQGEYGERGGNVFKAAGGPVAMGNAYIVGENGPEWFVPNTNGRIVPNAGGGGGGIGGDTYNIYNNSTGAAALTMAIIQQSHRARLSRSMGV